MTKRNRRILPLAAMEKLLKQSGAGRISDSAKSALAASLTIYAENICKKAIENSKHAGRVTVTDKDINLAAQHMRQAGISAKSLNNSNQMKTIRVEKSGGLLDFSSVKKYSIYFCSVTYRVGGKMLGGAPP